MTVLIATFIAVGDVSVVLLVVDAGWWSIPWSGTGGAMGAVSSMALHRAVCGGES